MVEGIKHIISAGSSSILNVIFIKINIVTRNMVYFEIYNEILCKIFSLLTPFVKNEILRCFQTSKKFQGKIIKKIIEYLVFFLFWSIDAFFIYTMDIEISILC